MDLAATENNNFGVVTEGEYDHQAKLLQEFYEIPSIEKAWVSQSSSCNGLQAMISMSQMNIPANKKRTFFLSTHIPEEVDNPANCHWSPFPVEQMGASLVVPSPSGLNVLVVRNGESSSKDASPPVQLEIWGPGQLRKEIFVPPSVHGPVYTDGWFEGVSWSSDETCIAYIAEEPATPQPIFTSSGCKSVTSGEKEPGSWKGQGDWLEDWGETYSGKRRPCLFVVNVKSGTVQVVEGIPDNLSVGQVVWAPHVSTNYSQYLVFVGWPVDSSDSRNPRMLGMKYCYNRRCALYAVRALFSKGDSSKEMIAAQKLTEKIDSAFLPRFSQDGELLVFLSASTVVNTGAHCSTNSLHSLHWPFDGTMLPNLQMNNVVSLVMCPREGCFPGLYCTNVLSRPWLSDGCTLVLSSIWGSMQVLLAINVVSGIVSRISPQNSNSSWNALAVHDNVVLAVSSSPVSPPKLKYGFLSRVDMDNDEKIRWSWLDIPIPFMDYSEKVKVSLSSTEFKILKIPVKDQDLFLTEGAKQPFEAIFVSSRASSESESQKNAFGEDACNPLIVILHGGPHSSSVTSFSRTQGFLSSLGYNLLYVNYRGSLGFGEEALQSLPGNVGHQDVADALNAVDLVIHKRLAIATKLVVLGGSHGGFLMTHLIGQVKVPVLLLLGAQDLRVPVSNGLQYARTLREKGVEVKVIVFPNDVHSIDRPQSDFESFLNIGAWFKRFLK